MGRGFRLALHGGYHSDMVLRTRRAAITAIIFGIIGVALVVFFAVRLFAPAQHLDDTEAFTAWVLFLGAVLNTAVSLDTGIRTLRNLDRERRGAAETPSPGQP